GLSAPITAAEDENPGRQVRRVGDERESRRDDRDLRGERGERPPARERDIEADQDQEKWPEARDGEPRHTRDESEVLQQKDESQSDEQQRPENTAPSRHDRTRWTRKRT